jgi:TPR repeat protein
MAAEWLRRAADGVVNAQFWYGRMLAEGRGVDANPVEGRHWIKRAADSGMIDAQVALGEMMVNGRGGPRDHAGALGFFTMAAEKGHAGAQFALGALLGGGHDVPTDRAAALGWFEKAAAKGHAYATLMLGRYLVRNLAGVQDIPRGRAMLEAALRAGVAEAGGDLAALDAALAARAPRAEPASAQPVPAV